MSRFLTQLFLLPMISCIIQDIYLFFQRGSKLGKTFLVSLTIFFLANNISAQWVKTTGLPGGDTIIYDVTVSGGNAIAGTKSGIFLSSTNGTNWTKAFNVAMVQSFASNGYSVVSGSQYSGVQLSTNNGASWTPVNSGITNLNVTSVFINGSTLFAGTSTGSIFISSNSGISWTPGHNCISKVSSFAFTNHVFAGTYGSGVFDLSTSSGGTAVNNGLTNMNVTSLTSNGNNIFAGTYGGGVYISTNNGTSWSSVNNGLSNTNVNSVILSGNAIFVGTNGGVFFSSVNNINWIAINSGLAAPFGNCVLSLASSSSNIFAGTYNGVWRIEISDLIPISPTLLYPNNLAPEINLGPSFSWNPSSLAVSYSLQLSTSPDFATLVANDSCLTATSVKVNNLLRNTTYYWRVNATNPVGTSAWDTIWSFTTTNIAQPLAPKLVSPSDSFTGISVNPLLIWNLTYSSLSYRIQVSTNSDFSIMLKDTSGVIDTSLLLSNLTNNTRYFWRVNAINDSGTSAWSTVRNFTTILSSPVLVSPINADTGVEIDPSFRWYRVNGATSYRLQVSTVSNFSSFIKDVANITDTIFAITGLQNNTRYYWRTNAINVSNTSSWPTAFSFTTIVSAPSSQPVLTSPSNNAIKLGTAPSFTWNAVAGATSYTIQISTVNDFSTIALSQGAITQTYFYAKGLKTGTLYYWRLKATNAGGDGPWSAVWCFTTIFSSAVLPTKFEINSFSIAGYSNVIKYALPTKCFVSLKYYDMLGKLVLSTVNISQNPGYYTLQLPISTWAKGAYVQVFNAGSFSQRQRIIISY